ncbi:MAG TPA: hypothetical protein VE621_03745 [Bryobacteraceae bacterium]|nr:hypothetical protein [Bryobacteraceae bacterium]
MQLRPNFNAGLGSTYLTPNPARGIQVGMVQNDSFGTWNMMGGTFDPRQIESRLRVFF